MTLIPFDPFRETDRLRRDFDHLFHPSHSYLEESFRPIRVDVHESDDEVVATFELAGLEKEDDVHINVLGHHLLSVSGKVNRAKEKEEGQYHRRERYIGTFHRSVSLPAPVSNEGVKANYRNGLLEIKMTKLEKPDTKKIDIEFH